MTKIWTGMNGIGRIDEQRAYSERSATLLIVGCRRASWVEPFLFMEFRMKVLAGLPLVLADELVLPSGVLRAKTFGHDEHSISDLWDHL